jgi:hypothetical protein
MGPTPTNTVPGAAPVAAPFADIGADEPVFVLRSLDHAAPAAVRAWALAHVAAGGRAQVAERALALAHAMEAWQRAHGSAIAEL